MAPRSFLDRPVVDELGTTFAGSRCGLPNMLALTSDILVSCELPEVPDPIVEGEAANPRTCADPAAAVPRRVGDTLVVGTTQACADDGDLFSVPGPVARIPLCCGLPGESISVSAPVDDEECEGGAQLCLALSSCGPSDVLTVTVSGSAVAGATRTITGGGLTCFTLLRAGSVTIAVTGAGYKPTTQTIQVGSCQPADVIIAMQKSAYRFRVTVYHCGGILGGEVHPGVVVSIQGVSATTDAGGVANIVLSEDDIPPNRVVSGVATSTCWGYRPTPFTIALGSLGACSLFTRNLVLEVRDTYFCQQGVNSYRGRWRPIPRRARVTTKYGAVVVGDQPGDVGAIFAVPGAFDPVALGKGKNAFNQDVPCVAPGDEPNVAYQVLWAPGAVSVSKRGGVCASPDPAPGVSNWTVRGASSAAIGSSGLTVDEAYRNIPYDPCAGPLDVAQGLDVPQTFYSGAFAYPNTTPVAGWPETVTVEALD